MAFYVTKPIFVPASLPILTTACSLQVLLLCRLKLFDRCMVRSFCLLLESLQDQYTCKLHCMYLCCCLNLIDIFFSFHFRSVRMLSSMPTKGSWGMPQLAVWKISNGKGLWQCWQAHNLLTLYHANMMKALVITWEWIIQTAKTGKKVKNHCVLHFWSLCRLPNQCGFWLDLTG